MYNDNKTTVEVWKYFTYFYLLLYNRIGGNLFDFFEDVVIKYN